MATTQMDITHPPPLLDGKNPDPVKINPRLEHRQTFIVLHGRGSNATDFSKLLTEFQTRLGSLETAFPHAKLIFLCSPTTYSEKYNELHPQWFDHWFLDKPYERQELMIEGLNKGCTYVHSVLEQEAQIVGHKNVVVMGFSQGCATSLTSLLTWEGEPFGAVVGLCGYLPFGNHFEKIAEDKGARDERTREAVEYLRKTIGKEAEVSMMFRKVPVLLVHGKADPNVKVETMMEAKRCLDLIGADVRLEVFPRVKHEISAEMVEEVLEFLGEKLRLPELA